MQMTLTEHTITRKAPRRKAVRAFKGEAARHVLDAAGFEKGLEVTGSTKGQFSFVDLIEAVLHKTGPATLVLSTWAASVADLGRLSMFYDGGAITQVRFLLDGAFESYNKATSIELREKFGDDNIRIVPNHAKFVLIKNDNWSVVIQTSMNLNQNRRIENFTVTECDQLYALYSSLIEDVWQIQMPSEGFGDLGYRVSSATLSKLGEGHKSSFYNVKAGSELCADGSLLLPL